MAPDPRQVAGVLQKAANHRPDVRRARVLNDPEAPHLMVADFTMQSGAQRRIEASAAKLCDGRTCGEILSDWLGGEPGDPFGPARPQQWHDEHARLMDNTPAGVLDLTRQGRVAPPVPARAHHHDPYTRRPVDEAPEATMPAVRKDAPDEQQPPHAPDDPVPGGDDR